MFYHLKKKKNPLTREVKNHQGVMPAPRLASCFWAYPSLFSSLLLSLTGYPQSVAGFVLEPANHFAPTSRTLVTFRERQRMDLSFYALTAAGSHPYSTNPCFFVLLYLCAALDGWTGNNLLCLIKKKWQLLFMTTCSCWVNRNRLTDLKNELRVACTHCYI